MHIDRDTARQIAELLEGAGIPASATKVECAVGSGVLAAVFEEGSNFRKVSEVRAALGLPAEGQDQAA